MEAVAPSRIVFVITDLQSGGAEMMLWKLLSRIDRSRFDPSVIALSRETDGILTAFHDIGVPCELLGMKPGRASPSALFQLARRLRELEPDLVQGWMYHGNLAATAGVAVSGLKVPVLWNVRGAVDSRSLRLTRFLIWASGRLSGWTARIINNSAVSAVQHEQRYGYPSSKRVVLPNGFDTDTFKPNLEARARVREALRLPQETLLVGLIGHYRPMKDHGNFLNAASLLKSRHPHVQYVLAGEFIDNANAELKRSIAEYGMQGEVHLLGQRDDMHAVQAALDIAVLSSSGGEGFPNVIGEAMSCGVPCVVTDVGDSGHVVGDTGVIVQPGDSEVLADGIARLIDCGEIQRSALGARARQRVIEHFSLGPIVSQYEALYREVHAHHAEQQGR